MDTSQWPQGIGSVVSTGENTRPTTENIKRPIIRPQNELSLSCPRCNSNKTRFGYYNNYSLSQPRYLCKTCKRYWTEGGNLRNVPVGGGSRKKKRPSSSPSSSSSSSSSSSFFQSVIPNLSPPKISPPNPRIHDGQTLNLYHNPSACNGMSEFGGLPFGLGMKNLNPQNPNFCSSVFSQFSDMGSMSSLISMPVSISNSFFSLSDLNNNNNNNNNMHGSKPRLSFSLDHGLENGYVDNLQAVQENTTSSSRIILPFEELKQVSRSDHRF